MPKIRKFGHGKLDGGIPNLKQSAKQPHPPTNPGDYDNEAHPGASYKNPGKKFVGPTSPIHTSDAVVDARNERFGGKGMQPTVAPIVSRPPPTNASGFGHSATQRSGALRMSGHKGAHRIGAK